MKRVLSLGVGLVVVSLVSCGGSTPPPAPTLPVAAAPDAGAPISVATAGAPKHGASAALKKAWPIDKPQTVIYADLRGLLRTPLMSAFITRLTAILATTEATPAQKQCVTDVVTNVQELAFGSDGDGGLLVARVDPSSTKWIGVCQQVQAPTSKPITMAGATEAWTSKSDFLAIGPDGLVLLGSKSLVERGLAGGNSGASLAAASLADGEYVSWVANVFDGEPPVKGRILATDERFRVAGEGDLPNVKLAERVEQQLDPAVLRGQIPKLGLAAEDSAGLSRLADALSLKRVGRHLSLALDLHEPPSAQASDLGAAAALGVYSVRQYLINAKQAEARNALGQLAKGMITDWEAERPGNQPLSKRKLVSFPAVPKTVPKGTKYQSTPADWKPWSKIYFEMSAPQYYQYEIKAAKDGESAEIIARGDLDGNGKTSEFKLLVNVQRPSNRLSVSPSITETNPDE